MTFQYTLGNKAAHAAKIFSVTHYTSSNILFGDKNVTNRHAVCDKSARWKNVLKGRAAMSTYNAESKIADLIGQSKQLQERTQALSDEHQALSVEFDLLSPENKCACQPPIAPVIAPGQ